MFGTKMADEFFAVHTGGDVAFVNGVLKVLLADRRRRRGVRATITPWASTSCVAELDRGVVRRSRGDVGHDPGRDGALRRALRRRRRRAVLVWSMGITQHRRGTDAVTAIVNLGLARGNVGRRGSGLMPIRGHSGVQGGAEMGAYATAFPGGVRDRRRRAAAASRGAVRLPGRRQARASPPRRWCSRAGRGEIDVLYSSGGNFLDVLPDPAARRATLWPACRCASTRTSW